VGASLPCITVNFSYEVEMVLNASERRIKKEFLGNCLLTESLIFLIRSFKLHF
jgi:hypothetical protein